MRTSWPTVVALALLAPLGLHSPPLQAQSMGTAQNARVIVKFKAGSALLDERVQAQAASAVAAKVERAGALSSKTGLALSDGRTVGPRSQVVHGRGLSSAALADRLSLDPDVEYAVVDQRRKVQMAPNDPLFPGNLTGGVTPVVGQWYLRAPDSTFVSAINAQGAWDRATGANVVVAVLDTGVRFDHPDLSTKFLPGYDFVSDVSTANDGSARDGDASDPGDWVSSAEAGVPPFADCFEETSSWHGTRVSGLVGAIANNGIGIAGVGADVKILPVRVLGKCGGYDSDIVAAMRWAAGISVGGVPANANRARVINMSLGGDGACSAVYRDAVTEVLAANTVVVASAGNEGLAVSSPANCTGVIAVAGVRHAGSKVDYSSLGSQVAISAPAGNCGTTTGACLYPLTTTTNTGNTTPSTNTYSDSFNFSYGTSFSAPLVAGTAALLISADPSLTPAQIRTHLTASARAFPTSGGSSGISACQAPGSTAQTECYCTTSTCGAGMLDAQAAVQRVVASAVLVPVISFNAPANATSTVTLDSSRSVVPGGHSTTIAWSIQSGASLVTVTSATNATTLVMQGQGSGDVVVRLSLTDTTTLQTATRDTTVRFGTVSAPVISSGDVGGGGGGGGLGIVWLAGLAMAVLALQIQRHRACPVKVSRRRR